MIKFQLKIFLSLCAFLIILFLLIPHYAQTDEPEKLQCTAPRYDSGEPMTYMVGSSKLSKKERKRIAEKYGTLTIPEGETEAALKRRESIKSRRQLRIGQIKDFYEKFKADPTSTPEEIEQTRKEMEELIKLLSNPPREKERLAMKKFDWRKDGGINVGKVYDQGDCNTCWAFAATDAAASSLEKQYVDDISNASEYTLFYDPVENLFSTFKGDIWWTGPPYYARYGDPRPLVQDLLNCLPITKEEICNNGWHGKALDFMVYDKGIPTALQRIREGEKEIIYKNDYQSGKKFACRPSAGFYGAVAWDYVNSPPDKIPTVQQLKKALIEHGPIIAPIVYDSCLGAYRGGVFNEQNLRNINHVVLLIGWDDEKGAWLIKNSWGEEWGEKGFGWIKYGSNNIGQFAAWIDADINTLKQIGCHPNAAFESGELNKVYEKYADQKDSIEVTNLSNVVTISGYVATEKELKKIQKYATEQEEKSECMKIINNVKVGCSEKTVSKIVDEAFARIDQLFLDEFPGETGDDIIWEVTISENGTMLLEGQLKTKKMRKKIYNLAKKIRKENKCIKKILNDLTIIKTTGSN